MTPTTNASRQILTRVARETAPLSRAKVSRFNSLNRQFSQQRPLRSEKQPQQPTPEEPPQKLASPHIGFYKSFGRPVAKVFLMAIAVYQITYWAWVKLESDELQRIKTAELEGLEGQLKELVAAKEEAKSKAESASASDGGSEKSKTRRWFGF